MRARGFGFLFVSRHIVKNARTLPGVFGAPILLDILGLTDTGRCSALPLVGFSFLFVGFVLVSCFLFVGLLFFRVIFSICVLFVLCIFCLLLLFFLGLLFCRMLVCRVLLLLRYNLLNRLMFGLLGRLCLCIRCRLVQSLLFSS